MSDLRELVLPGLRSIRECANPRKVFRGISDALNPQDEKELSATEACWPIVRRLLSIRHASKSGVSLLKLENCEQAALVAMRALRVWPLGDTENLDSLLKEFRWEVSLGDLS